MASTQVTGTRLSGARGAPITDGVRAVAAAVLGGWRDLATPRSSIAALAVCALAASCLRAGSLSGPDAVLAFSLLLHLGAARTTAAAPALWGIGQAGAVFCAIAAFGALSWPAALWIVAVPAAAWRAGDRSASILAISGAGAAFGLLASADYLLTGDGAAMVPGQIAVAYLIAATVFGSAMPGLHRVVSDPAATVEPERAASLLELADDLVLCHRVDGDVLRVDGGRIAGDAQRLRGQGLFDSVHVPDRPAFLRALSDAAHLGAATRVLVRIRAEENSSELRWIELRASPARPEWAHLWPAGTVVHSVLRDVSDLRREVDDAEANLRAATNASADKSRFLGSVTHELRTPLNAIIGFAELLSGEHPFVLTPERGREYAGIVRDSGRHLVDVVNTLLDVAKIEGGQFAFAPEPVDLATLAQGCCDLLQLVADKAGVTVSAVVVGDVPRPTADPRACRQILINLLANAIKFTPAGGCVTIAVRHEGAHISLSVRDDGVGIRENDLSRVGDPFFQAGGQPVLPADGTGLGLSVVRGLVGLHRGAMTIESGPGLGTNVTIELPLQAAVEPGPSVAVRTVARRPAPTLDDARFERMSA